MKAQVQNFQVVRIDSYPLFSTIASSYCLKSFHVDWAVDLKEFKRDFKKVKSLEMEEMQMQQVGQEGLM